MQVVDFHTHVFPDGVAPRAIERVRPLSPLKENFVDGTVSGLLESMARAGVALSVNLPVATKEEHVAPVNAFAATVARTPGFASFGTLFPPGNGFDEQMESVLSRGLPGVKIHPEHQDFFADDRRIYPLYERLAASRLIVAYHAGSTPGDFPNDRATPRSILRVHRDFPHLRIVATHMGGLFMWDDVETTLLGSDVYLDTSSTSRYIEPARLVAMIRRHGAEKVLFGTDSPWYDQEAEIRWFDTLPLTSGEKETILSANAWRLLGDTEG